MAIDETLLADLRKQAARETWDESEDFNPMDFSGGNFDDAYWGGQEDGATHLARRVLTALGEGA